MSATVTQRYLPRQWEFLNACDRVPFAAYIGGFGSGKSHVLCLQVLREAATKSYGLIGAPSYRLLADTTQRKFFELCPPEWIKIFRKSENKVDLINGSEIIFRSLDSPERLTNLGLDWFGLDEVGEIKVETFRMLQGRLRNPGGSHHGFGVGNPAGPTHWTYEYYVLKAQEFPDEYHLTQATSYENTFLDRSYALNMERSFGKDSLYYKRFVLGQFVAFEGAYWPQFDIRPYPDGFILRMDQIKGRLDGRVTWRFGRVVDFGYEHPFVCLWFVTDGTRIVFYDEYYISHETIRHHCQSIQQKTDGHREIFGPHLSQIAYTDHEATVRAELANCTDENNKPIGFVCTPAKKDVMPGILLVQTLIERKYLYITERCKHTRLEIPSYRAKSVEKSTKEQPIKEKDDTCDCVRMACYSELNHLAPFIRQPRPVIDFPIYTSQQTEDEFEKLGHYSCVR